MRVRATVARSYVEIVAMFQVDCMIAGLAPYQENLVILAHVTEDADDADDAAATTAAALSADGTPTGLVAPARRVAARPELRILSRTNEDLSSDALPINGFQHYACTDYRLDYNGACLFAGVFVFFFLAVSVCVGVASVLVSHRRIVRFTLPADSGSEPLFYILAPKDIVMARPRDHDDHINWLLEHQKFEAALDFAELHASIVKQHRVLEVGEKYLRHLLELSHFGRAAAVCPKLLGTNAKLWEAWIYMCVRFASSCWAGSLRSHLLSI